MSAQITNLFLLEDLEDANRVRASSTRRRPPGPPPRIRGVNHQDGTVIPAALFQQICALTHLSGARHENRPRYALCRYRSHATPLGRDLAPAGGRGRHEKVVTPPYLTAYALASRSFRAP
jgi:hypothetical protein